MQNDCVCQHYVKAAFYGSSSSGYGCLATGGHCLPNDNDCDSLQKHFIERQNLIQSIEIVAPEKPKRIPKRLRNLL